MSVLMLFSKYSVFMSELVLPKLTQPELRNPWAVTWPPSAKVKETCQSALTAITLARVKNTVFRATIMTVEWKSVECSMDYNIDILCEWSRFTRLLMLIGLRVGYGFEEDRLPFYTHILHPRISTKLGR